ncbi:EAL domain-containing protein [Schinkia sp. CFF1]
MRSSLIEKQMTFSLPFQQDEQCFHMFQPIYQLEAGQCYGYEALLRSNSYNPLTLFKMAEEKQHKSNLDLLSAQNSIQAFSKSAKNNDCLLFINLFPSTLIHSSCTYLYDFIKLNPVTAYNRIVIEISESESLDDLHKFTETVLSLKKAGYLIAIDDVGAGTSSLTKLTVACPDIIKIDRWFAHRLSESKEKQDIIKRFMRFCGNDIQIVLEGIETREDLEAAKSLGLVFGQGYYLGIPAPL